MRIRRVDVRLLVVITVFDIGRISMQIPTTWAGTACSCALGAALGWTAMRALEWSDSCG